MSAISHIMIYRLVIALLLFSQHITCNGQEFNGEKILFSSSNAPLPLKFTYSNKQIKKEKDPKAYTKSIMHYKANNEWVSLQIEFRARGNFRRGKCYFPPLKMKLKKSLTQGSLFQNQKKLKIVLPCLIQSSSNDAIIKEYIAYKIFEIISEFHFKTRLATIEYTDLRAKLTNNNPLSMFIAKDILSDIRAVDEESFTARKPRKYLLNAILIEDDKNVAKRMNGNIMDRFIHPLNQDPVASVRNALFQYLIGNTDFSTAYGHNQKLLFTHGKTIPIPYDFDMSGLVDASYAVVSIINNKELPITDVKQRLYRGFKRDSKVLKQVRAEFIDKKMTLLNIIDSNESLFDNPKTFQKTKNYVISFFEILEDDNKFKREIIDKSRTK